MKIWQILVAGSFLLFASCKQQKLTSSSAENTPLTIGFYNVENLFDTLDDPSIRDEEYLPGAEKGYNTERYNEKLQHLSLVIDEFKPDMLGVCEVENEAVLIDLCATLMQKHQLNYKVAHHNSPDRRGIDVAFIYNPKAFKAQKLSAYSVTLAEDTSFITRDVLCFTATNAKDSFYFFANHWPSRSGGQAASEHKRVAAAQTLSTQVERLLKRSANAKIIIMGDFNDEPFNESIAKHLKADSTLNAKSSLFNTSYYMINEGTGTYNYRGNWNVLDQIIVSRNLVNNDLSDGEVMPPRAQVVKKEFMLYETRSGQKVPSRSYGGPNYYGGYSDHLPTYIVLKKKG